LVVDVDALEAVDLLNLVDEIRLQRFLAEHVEDVVWIARTIHQWFAGADAFAFLNVDVHATGQRVFARLRTRLVWNDQDLALSLDDAAVLDDAIDLGDDRGLAWLSRFEQLDDAR